MVEVTISLEGYYNPDLFYQLLYCLEMCVSAFIK